MTAWHLPGADPLGDLRAMIVQAEQAPVDNRAAIVWAGRVCEAVITQQTWSHVLLHYEQCRMTHCAVAEFALLGEHNRVVRSTSNYLGAEWVEYVTKRRLGVIALGWTPAITQMWQTIELSWDEAIEANGLVLHHPGPATMSLR